MGPAAVPASLAQCGAHVSPHPQPLPYRRLLAESPGASGRCDAPWATIGMTGAHGAALSHEVGGPGAEAHLAVFVGDAWCG